MAHPIGNHLSSLCRLLLVIFGEGGEEGCVFIQEKLYRTINSLATKRKICYSGLDIRQSTVCWHPTLSPFHHTTCRCYLQPRTISDVTMWGNDKW